MRGAACHFSVGSGSDLLDFRRLAQKVCARCCEAPIMFPGSKPMNFCAPMVSVLIDLLNNWPHRWLSLSTTARSGDSGKGHAPRCTPKTAVLTPLPIYQNAPLDEISVYQVVPQTAFFGPDPLPDPQIGLSCHQLEKFPPAAQQGAPAGHSRVPTGTSTGRPLRPAPVQ